MRIVGLGDYDPRTIEIIGELKRLLAFHSIENVGAGELVTLFWSSEVFDPDQPDTQALPVLTGSAGQ